MAIFSSSTSEDQRIGMTLAAIAYFEPQQIPEQLAFPGYATGGNWQLVWLGITTGNQVYVAKNTQGGPYVVAIRGSASDPESEAFWIDWFEEDFEIFRQASLPFAGPPADALISHGSLEGLEDLQKMTNSLTDTAFEGADGADGTTVATGAGGETLVQFLERESVFEQGPLVVLGHSLGGALVSVLAPYLAETLSASLKIAKGQIVPMTFAAPTGGNPAFASYLEDIFAGYPYRNENTLDIVPHGWSLSGLEWVTSTYDPKPSMNIFLRGLADALIDLLKAENLEYTQPGPGVFVEGQLQKTHWWFKEAGHQHSSETYLALYGAPTVHNPPPSSD